MNILVTGGSGFIGSHLVDKLIDAGHKVRVLDIKAPHRENVDFLEGDITSREDVTESLGDIDIVYHTAAFSNIDLVKAHPLATIEQNIMGTAYLLEECRQREIRRFILASSVYVYEERGHLYTTSKIASELLCKNYYTLYSLPYTILRYGTAYGPRSRGADAVSIFVQRAWKGESLGIHGSGEQQRHFSYVEDLALGSVAALSPVAQNKTYTLASREAVTVRHLAEIVRGMFHNKVAIEYDSARPDDYQEALADLEKTRGELGWEPQVSLEEGIKRYIAWFNQQAT
ncbi:MAG: NAD-dependent epimerase/dehydratase family protein [Chloroflexi bacterium]|nr:NAD-dependent epimerase/dehydratase family protein [Chloroflexota bacterium]